MADVLTRRDIWSLEDEGPWHPITEAYARGVAVMQQRDPGDPTSWAHQAAIHGASTGDWRTQCQHNSWYFLPWHRMYLYYLEEIVRAALQEVPEVSADVRDTWTLPYWDYARGGRFATLPAAFREQTLADGQTPNALFVAERADFINDGDGLTPEEADSTNALRQALFSDPRAPAFGGAVTGLNHFSEDAAAQPGALELAPHNVVHSTIGGLMGDFDTAGLDPVFWMHHANIDRLWSVWMAQDGRANPDDTRWTSERFTFSDAAGNQVTKDASEVVDSVAGLQYNYENQEPPAAAPRRRRAAMTSQRPPDHPPELVGASDAAVDIDGDGAAIAFEIGAATGPARRGVTAGAGPRMYLNLEGVEGERDPGVAYGVYLNLPDADGDGEPERHRVGNVSFFGIEKAAGVDDDAAHPLSYAFDVTDVVERLREEGHWDPARVSVTISPLRKVTRRGVTGEPSRAPVKVGRIGLYSH